jgi:hypothetical protein
MLLKFLVKHSLALWKWTARIFPNTVLLFLVAGLVEKPDAERAPSNLVSIRRYVLMSDIFDIFVINLLVLVARSNWLMLLTPRLKTSLLKLLGLTGVALIVMV